MLWFRTWGGHLWNPCRRISLCEPRIRNLDDNRWSLKMNEQGLLATLAWNLYVPINWSVTKTQYIECVLNCLQMSSNFIWCARILICHMWVLNHTPRHPDFLKLGVPYLKHTAATETQWRFCCDPYMTFITKAMGHRGKRGCLQSRFFKLRLSRTHTTILLTSKQWNGCSFAFGWCHAALPCELQK